VLYSSVLKKTFGVIFGWASCPKKTTVGVVINNRPLRIELSQNVPSDTARDTIEMGMLIKSMPLYIRYQEVRNSAKAPFGVDQKRATASRPLSHHAARRCSSISSSASAVSLSPFSASSAATAALGSGSSGTSGSASHAARWAAATVATPPRCV